MMTDTQNHDSRISVVKALAIILMVVGHSGCPEAMSHWIYLFHMPAFFFVSGFLLKEKNFDAPWRFVSRRVKGLWWPFVKWSLVFLLLHNLFAWLHLYPSPYSWSDYPLRIFKILTMTGSEQMLGGFWFLKVLLYASLISYFMLMLLRMGKVSSLINWGGWMLSLLFVVVAFGVSVAPFKIPTIGSGIFLSAAFFTAGYAYRRSRGEERIPAPAVLVCAVAVVAVSLFFHGSIDIAGWGVFPYFLCGLVGTYALLGIASRVRGVLMRVLNYIGSATLYILTFHFLSFKLVSLVVVAVYGLPMERLSDFPFVAHCGGSWWWALYSAVGVAMPVLLWHLKCAVHVKKGGQ